MDGCCEEKRGGRRDEGSVSSGGCSDTEGMPESE